MRFAIAQDVMADFGKLGADVRNRVADMGRKVMAMTAEQLRASKGLHLEQYNDPADERARTIKLGENHRGMLAHAGDDLLVLVRVGTHAEVDRWMRDIRFGVNPANGAFEIINVTELERAAEGRADAPDDRDGALGLFTHRREKDFVQLGVSEVLLPAILSAADEAKLLELASLLPRSQADAVLALHGDQDVDAIWKDLLAATDIPSRPIDTDDLAAAIEAGASRDQLVVLTDDQQLHQMLAEPMAKWKHFLHPTQRRYATRTYNGPARITGGAGTGKTVVAIHRARHLADAFDAHSPDRQGRPILFTTFTRNLADAIEEQLKSLAGPDILDIIEVKNVDRVVFRLAAMSNRKATFAYGDEVKELFQEAIDDYGLEFTPEFLFAEYEQVILAQPCTTRSEYFDVVRAGRGVRLNRRERAKVWKAVEYVNAELAGAGKRSPLHLADDAAAALANREISRYRHIIVDEAQDLHPAHWRLLRAAVDPGENDLLIVGDTHQRIYDRRASLGKLGINIVGRSHRLKINYRTTYEVLAWALRVLGDGEFDDLAGGNEPSGISQYHSYLHGPEPTVQGFDTTGHQTAGIVEHIRRWVANGVDPQDIGIASRSKVPLELLRTRLNQEGVPAVVLGQKAPTEPGVQLGTMHRMKGLEFRCVALVDIDDNQVPLASAVTGQAADPVQYGLDIQRERCLVYVAATRARDDLWVSWRGTPSPFLPS